VAGSVTSVGELTDPTLGVGVAPISTEGLDVAVPAIGVTVALAHAPASNMATSPTVAARHR
jgi:hypothetical protein